jgi:hypothetical protein
VLRQAPKPCGRFRCCPARRSTIAKFADHLGFRVTYRQVRPNPYVALDRDGLELHYFGIPGFLPEDSYGSCVVRRPGPWHHRQAGGAPGSRGVPGRATRAPGRSRVRLLHSVNCKLLDFGEVQPRRDANRLVERARRSGTLSYGGPAIRVASLL